MFYVSIRFPFVASICSPFLGLSFPFVSVLVPHSVRFISWVSLSFGWKFFRPLKARLPLLWVFVFASSSLSPTSRSHSFPASTLDTTANCAFLESRFQLASSSPLQFLTLSLSVLTRILRSTSELRFFSAGSNFIGSRWLFVTVGLFLFYLPVISQVLRAWRPQFIFQSLACLFFVPSFT